MMKSLKTVVKRLVKTARRHVTYMRLNRLRESEALPAGRIAKVISGAITNDSNASERQRLEKIEKLRGELSKCEDIVEISDYGAGTPSSNRTEEEMVSGTTYTTTVANASRASKSPFWSLVLFKLLREFKPAKCIELGSCVGISAAYQAAALEFNGHGTLITMEGAESLAAISAKTLEALQLDNARVVTGRFQDNLQKALIEEGPIDYVFVDGHHDELATLSYFEMCLPHLSESAIVVFDDISWSAGMRRAWDKISQHEKLKLTFDLRAIGICVLDPNLTGKRHLRFYLG